MMILVIFIIFSTAGFSKVLDNNSYNFFGSSRKTIYVNYDGTADYIKIQEAIDNASFGDTIFVYEGVYNETIFVDKTLKIVGENKSVTFIDGMYNEKIIQILADNVVFTDFTLKNSNGFKGNAAVYIKYDNVTISNCIIYRTRTGIIIDSSNNINIKDCLLHTNGEGISVKYSKTINIKDSEICHNGLGVNLYKSKNIVFENIYLHENSHALFINDSSNIEIIHCASCDNNDNGGGVLFYASRNIFVENCNIIHSGVGFKIINSTNLYFNKCNLEYTSHFTFWIQDKSDNIVINQCNIINNFRHGIHITDSNCKIENCNLYDNFIESVIPSNSFVYAKNNYWGSKLGPVFSKGFRLVDILIKDFGKIKFFPYSIKKFENIGADWNVEDIFEKIIIHGYGDDQIKLVGKDIDLDGLPDWWEQEFGYNVNVWDDHLNLDPDGDALNNFEECYAYDWDANPFKKDIFLEFDYTKSMTSGASNIPPEKYINEMKERFSERNISLHVDLGDLGGGEEIPYITNFNFDGLIDMYWNYFLHNDLNNPRKNIFHYGLICDKGPGNGFAFIGWAHLNGFCISADVIQSNHPLKERGWLITCGSMHETGHTLGLIADDFGGNDNHASSYLRYREFWYYRNYKSVMNYRYSYSILDFSDGDNGKVDFDDWTNMEFDFFKNTHFEWPNN
jgi:parallel beta-helix repeat protein